MLYIEKYDTRLYRGSFVIVSGAENYARVNTSTGYYDCKEKRHYYYLANRQGSVMAVIDDQGTTVQRTGLYPSGTPFVLPSDIRLTPAKSATPTLTPATDRLHIGNRWLGHSGLNRYDNTARLHDPLLLRFDTPDPLATKFPGINPWNHTAANPANAIDPDGREFTASSLPYIKGYVENITQRIESIESKIEKQNQNLANGKVSLKKYDSKIAQLNQQKLNLNSILDEINLLTTSTQVYNIKIDKSYNSSDVINGYNRSGIDFNDVTGEIDINLGDNTLGMLSHELKHAFQFETGNLSIIKGNGYTFYDLTDEKDAFDRSSMFGLNRPKNFYSLYNYLKTTPTGMFELSPNQKSNPTILQQIAIKNNNIFRWNGITYLSK